MDDAKVVERMLVFGVQRLAEGMENSLKRLVVPRSEEFPGNNVGVHDISSWVHRLVVVGVSVVDVGSWIAHRAPLPTWR
ncbi:hypothetical protein [Haloarcula halophila]|uniref:hypothetical protein n=1 Tax=Haloarcula halophila TaxID=3032584 RepID=UPI0023E3999E|nr:hypothetical protein [Halomicroarcula sp. DFY41]